MMPGVKKELRRRVQGEDTRCAVPWKGATRRLTSRGRLGHAESPRVRIPRTPRSGVEPGDATSAALGTAAPWKEPRLRSGGRTNQHPDLSTTASGAGGKTGFAAPAARLRTAAPAQGESGAPRRKGRRRAGPPTLPNRRRAPGQDRNPPPPPDRGPREGTAAPGGATSRGRTGRTEARRTDRARRHPGAFA